MTQHFTAEINEDATTATWRFCLTLPNGIMLSGPVQTDRYLAGVDGLLVLHQLGLGNELIRTIQTQVDRQDRANA